jgi:L-2-hydroxyglutarate oxidase LhgO
MDRVDALVVGAGVVGLAVGRALALRGLETVVVEQATAIGTETSARNSEVVHAGLYYPTGSLKARLCVSGKHRLYAYCAQRGIAHRRCGKLVVATDAQQVAALYRLAAQAQANGVDDVRLIDAAAALAKEPALACVAALESPSTGIVDSHALMLSLQGDLEDHGGALALATRVERVDPARPGDPARHRVRFSADGQAMALAADVVVNAAGLWAPLLARRFAALDPARLPQARFAKGSYFSLAGRAPFSRLIYPVPEPGGLGVHLTLDLAGQARFGPDVQWLDIDSPAQIDYAADASRLDDFCRAIRRYWPALPEDRLQPDYAGVRPKLSCDAAAADFVIEGEAAHGVPGLLNLFGIESPGLTAALAIADEAVARLLDAAPRGAATSRPIARG